MKGRVLGRTPERGDIVIVTPPGTRTDYIKRVDRPARRHARDARRNPVPQRRAGEAAAPARPADPDRRQFPVRFARRPGADHASAPAGRTASRCAACRSSARPCPTAAASTPSSWAASTTDNFGPIRVPAGHLFLMGDNRDDSADSRVPEWQGGLGGPVPIENIGGRAEFITFSLDGTTNGIIRSAGSGRCAPTAPASPQERLMAKAPVTRSARRAARTGGIPRSDGPPGNAPRGGVDRHGARRRSGSSSLPSR